MEVDGLEFYCVDVTELGVCQSRLLVCPIPGSHRLKVTAKTAEILQKLKKNMVAGKIELSSDEVQAVGEVTDKANAAQGDRSL